MNYKTLKIEKKKKQNKTKQQQKFSQFNNDLIACATSK